MSTREQTLTTADLARAAEQHESGSRDNAPVPPQMRAMDPDRDGAEPLLPRDEINDLRSRWHDIQGSFVDDPRRAVEEADMLVANAIKLLAESFSNERSRMEHEWDRGDQVDTESLRNALRKYRSFFERLLNV